MVKKAEEMVREITQRMQGGAGDVIITHLFEGHEYDGQARRIAQITLSPECSIGPHAHEGEEELIFMLEGRALYTEDGAESVLEKGDASLLKPGVVHSIANQTDEDILFLSLILTY